MDIDINTVALHKRTRKREAIEMFREREGSEGAACISRGVFPHWAGTSEGAVRACVCVCRKREGRASIVSFPVYTLVCLLSAVVIWQPVCRAWRGHGNEFTALVRGQLQAVWTAHVSVERYSASNPVKVHFKSPSLEFLVAFGSLRLKYWERHCKNCLNRAMGAVSYEQTAWWETDPDLEREGSGWTHCMLLYTPKSLVLFSHFRK